MSDKLYDGEDHTSKYCLYRSGYPKELFEHIINYYFNDRITNEKVPFALDIGCGNGQATVDLSRFCERIIGIDVSEDQIRHAILKDNIEYRCNKGENLSFLQSNSIDLITVATTFHWLNIDEFFKEVKRILKPQTGVLAIWTYTFGTLDNPKAEEIYREFRNVLLYPYWNEKQHLVNDYYESLIPLFPYKSTLKQYTIECHVEKPLEQFLGLIETASACQTYRKQNGEQQYQNMLNTLRQNLIQSYIDTDYKNDQNQNIDFNSIKINISRPIRLYLMKKGEP